MRRLGGAAGRTRSALRSLRWRLTLTYVLLLGLLLVLLGVYEFATLRTDLVASRVSTLSGDNAAARALFVRNQVVGPNGTRVPRAVCAAGSGTAGARPAVTLATTILSTAGRNASVVVYDRLQQVVAEAPTSTTTPHLDPAALGRGLAGQQGGPQEIDTPDGTMLVVGFPIEGNGRGVCGVSQLSVPFQPITAVLDGVRTQLLVGGIAVLLLALAAGLALTSSALRPLRRVTETARSFAGGDLRARSHLPPRSDEVGLLARSFDDMADRIEEAFAQREEADARTRRFIADASHELRTPVTALKGYIDVLRRGASRDAQVLDASLGAMAREAERMRLLVLDLLTLARLDSHQGLRIEPLDLTAAVRGLLDEGNPAAPPVVARELSAEPVTAMADRQSVVTVLRNLWGNACKYAPGAAQVWRTWAEDRRVAVSVHDDGPGIPASDLPHVFERFYRGEKTRAREEGGSGLGLSIVHGLVQAQGGEVRVESTEGHGTTVTVWLPRAQAGSDVEG